MKLQIRFLHNSTLEVEIHRIPKLRHNSYASFSPSLTVTPDSLAYTNVDLFTHHSAY